MEDERAAGFVFIHQAAVAEVLNKGVLALNTGIRQTANFFAVETIPFALIKIVIELCDRGRLDEVDKRIANVALVLKIDRQVKEIILPMVLLVQLL